MNDGDPELSAPLADMALKDSRFRVLEKENGGVSSARNLGIDNAKGEWLVFVDPDDRIECDYIERLLSVVKDGSVDYAIGGFTIVNKIRGYERTAFIEEFQSGCVRDIGSVLREICTCWPYPFSKIYRRSVLNEYRIRYKEEISFSEDLEFNLQVASVVDKVAFLSDSGYRYMVRGGSVTQNYCRNMAEDIKMTHKTMKDLLYMKSNSPEEANAIMVSVVGNYAFPRIMGNYFLPGNDMSFVTLRNKMKKELFESELWSYYRQFKGDDIPRGFLSRIMKFCVNLKSPTIVILFVRLLYSEQAYLGPLVVLLKKLGRWRRK